MRRREFLGVLGGAVSAWPLVAHAQQASMPVVGLLRIGAPAEHLIRVFRQALAEAGFVEGRNVVIDYRPVEGDYERLPALATDLVRRPVTVIVAITTPPALAARAATATVPIVFSVPDDPVKLGLVTSLARPSGNATGVNFMLSELGAKQLGLLHELVPRAARFGLLVNPHNTNAEAVKDVMTAASAIGVGVDVREASDSRGIEAAFSVFAQNRIDALVVGTDRFFFRRRLQLATLATRHAIPAVFNAREYAEVGGLIAYGTSLVEVYRQVGIYTGRILKGEKPADLPVVQSSKFELVINLPTARAFGLEIPPQLLARADEVIE